MFCVEGEFLLIQNERVMKSDKQVEIKEHEDSPDMPEDGDDLLFAVDSLGTCILAVWPVFVYVRVCVCVCVCVCVSVCVSVCIILPLCCF
jgi:hypothetical protein